jgi:hypothetical protein
LALLTDQLRDLTNSLSAQHPCDWPRSERLPSVGMDVL